MIYSTKERGFAEKRHRNTPYFPRNGENNRRREFSAQGKFQWVQNYFPQNKRMGQKNHFNMQKKSEYSPASSTFRNFTLHDFSPIFHSTTGFDKSPSNAQNRTQIGAHSRE